MRDRREDIESAEREVVGAIERLGYDAASAFAIRLALEEALVNGFRHGNKGDPTKVVRLHFVADACRVDLEIEDEGEGFDPEAVPDPTDLDNIEIPSGRGLMLMRAYMTEVEFSNRGNRVKMSFKATR